MCLFQEQNGYPRVVTGCILRVRSKGYLSTRKMRPSNTHPDYTNGYVYNEPQTSVRITQVTVLD
jgi:hypothetical protein